MDEELRKIGERLKALRVEKSDSLEDVAKITGISKSLLSKYERGLNDPGLKALKKLVKYYSVSLDWLFGFTEDRKPIFTNDPLRGLTEAKKIEVIQFIEFVKSKE